MNRLVVTLSSFLWLLAGVAPVQAQVECTATPSCVEAFQEGSECVDGYCTNPFHGGGCLAKMLPGWTKLRVCHSEDPPEAAVLGHCRPGALGYAEVRIIALNWESSFFTAWIMQILLSEVLDVPVSIEAGAEGLVDDFYHLQNQLDYGPSEMEVLGLEAASKYLDCRTVPKSTTTYTPCGHVSPELWEEDDGYYDNLLERNLLEEPMELGALAEQNWFVPKFAAVDDPSILSYLGMTDRVKLAETFKTPTSWTDYCTQVSPDNCATPDGVATRAPSDDWEGESYFGYDEYIGHFRKLPAQDCVAYPDTCYGHLTDYPCGWSSFSQANAHHLGLPLKATGPDVNAGYSYSQLTQIWAAAEATRSPVLMMWWKPEALYQTYLGTEAEFTRVGLPPPTQTCFDNRADQTGDCANPNYVYDLGIPAGACDNAPQSLRKGISSVLRQLSQNPETPEELWSPAYETVRNYRITDLEYGEIFEKWLNRGVDAYGYDPRLAACEWVVENFEAVQSFIPETYPRSLEYSDSADKTLFKAAYVVAIFVAFCVIVSTFLTYSRRKTQVIYFTQIEFMYLIQAGLLLVVLSAWFRVAPTTSIVCALIPWVNNMGYVMILVPLLMRIDAINRILSSGKQMQRVRVPTKMLFAGVTAGLLLVCAFCVVWSLADPAGKEVHYDLTTAVTKEGASIVYQTDYCAKGGNIWYTVSVSWQAVLLLFPVALAFMASRVREDVNDTRILALLVMSHFLFAMLRVATLVVRDSTNPVDILGYESLILSADVFLALVVFVFPKVLQTSEAKESDEPLPDLFLRTSILYADIAGFSAWSSVREPAQVFQFLESAYSAFDRIAEQRNVFKVETIADTYVAATGIPNARSDHAVALARFAMDMMSVFGSLTKALEVKFGPDTGDLSLRVGIHSGAITGGFLKGKGARFQLFGDTANVARNIMFMGERGRCQVSEETAQAIIAAGKSRWLKKRDESIVVFGHGKMQTYWLLPTQSQSSGNDGGADFSEAESVTNFSDRGLNDIVHETSTLERQRRLIDWNVEVLHQLLKEISAQRMAVTEKSFDPLKPFSVAQLPRSSSVSQVDSDISATDMIDMPLNEVKEIIALPEFNSRAAKRRKDADEIVLPSKVLEELNFFVRTVAELYQDNPFHNFAHASHVVMAVSKHMSRIVAPADLNAEDEMHIKHKAAAALHDHTYGITSDPLTQFACVFSALIHDLDHPGVPNPQLIKEDPAKAASYRSRSVAEQHSFALAWQLLLQPEVSELRLAICGDSAGMVRFRQLVINSVMATDLGDKELKKLRNGRWDKAFQKEQPGKTLPESPVGSPATNRIDLNRKATIVIEHLIQASDVSHTMQHWEIYREWNANLFAEMYAAYRMGRADTNPADSWYQGEIGFFDFYIIPLSNKLAECGVFGISSDENLNYATRNRELWVALGNEATAEMLAKCEKEWSTKEDRMKPDWGSLSIPEGDYESEAV